MGKHNQVKLLLKLHKLESNGDGIDEGGAFKKLAKTLDPSLLKRYRKLREKKGTGVAVLENGVCTGCKMVYPESHDVFRYKNFVYSCEYCSRLLVVVDKSA